MLDKKTWRPPTEDEIASLIPTWVEPEFRNSLEVNETEHYFFYRSYNYWHKDVKKVVKFKKYWCVGGPLHGTFQAAMFCDEYYTLNASNRAQFVKFQHNLISLMVHESLLPPLKNGKPTHA
jgi:hypothetical protein